MGWEAHCMAEEEGFSTQPSRRPYGRGLAANYGLEDASHIVTRVSRQAELAVTEIHAKDPPIRVSDPIARQDAFLIGCQLQERDPFEYFEEERSVGTCTLKAGDITIRDLRRDPRSMTAGPFHSVLWFLPRASLNAVADEANARHVDELLTEPCVGTTDDVIQRLSASMLQVLQAPEQANRLFTDHVAIALAWHVACTYGAQHLARPIRGGLAPWQVKRAKEMILHDLSGSTSVEEIATACGLSASHFARSFRKTTGFAPHTWLLRARVERAMALLRQRDVVLGDVAAASGFANQSHFARVFTRLIGMSPSTWRRQSAR
jgi:AraC family transcriptional regulator